MVLPTVVLFDQSGIHKEPRRKFRIKISSCLSNTQLLDNRSNAETRFPLLVLRHCRESSFSRSLRAASDCFGRPRQIQVPGGTYFVQAAYRHPVGRILDQVRLFPRLRPDLYQGLYEAV